MNIIDTEVEVVFVEIFRKQFEGYTNQDVERYRLVREIQVMAGHPSER